MKGGGLLLATKEQRQNKKFVEKLLLIQGIDYDDWVDKIHLEYIQENNKLIFEALDSKLDKRKERKDEQEQQNQQPEKLNENRHQLNNL